MDTHRAQSWRPRDRTRRLTTAAVFVALGLTGLVTAIDLAIQIVHGGPHMAIAVPALLAYGLAWVGLIRVLDRRRMLRWRAGLLALAWGGAVATALSRPVEMAIRSGLVSAWGARTAAGWQAAVAAPPVEEGFKALGVLALAVVLRRGLAGPLHGMLLGAVTGLGFAVVEDVGYVAKAHASLLSVLERTLGGLGSHEVLTALCGLALGLLLCTPEGPRPRRRQVVAGVACLAGLGLHFANDTMALHLDLITALRPALGLAAAEIVGVALVPALTVVVGVLAYRWTLVRTPSSPSAQPVSAAARTVPVQRRDEPELAVDLVPGPSRGPVGWRG